MTGREETGSVHLLTDSDRGEVGAQALGVGVGVQIDLVLKAIGQPPPTSLDVFEFFGTQGGEGAIPLGHGGLETSLDEIEVGFRL